MNLALVIILAATPSVAASGESFPLRQDGSIPVWTVAGPLPNARALEHGDHCFGYFKDYLGKVGGETGSTPAENDPIDFGPGQAVAWKTALSDANGLLDYIDILRASREAPGVAYAFCRLLSDTSREARLKIRSNDGVRVWVGRDLVHDQHVSRTIDSAEDTVPVTLHEGENRLLVKVEQTGGDWGLLLRVVGADGAPVAGIRTAVAAQTTVHGRLLSADFSGAPVVLKTADGPRQVVIARITSGGLEDVTCKITRADWPEPCAFSLGDLPLGEHRLELKVPVIAKSGPARVALQWATGRHELADVILPEPRPWVVYLVQHVHTDIGYTRPQTEILPEHLRYIDYVLDYCDLTDDYPDDARFRWTCEITWAVREYLKRRPQAQIDRLKRRVAEGRVEIAGMFLNMSEIATEASLAASLQPIRTITDQLGVPVETAMQNDVNGAAWCLADFYHDIGVKYFVMGINRTRSVLPFDRPTPFWWESPSGKRVLGFRADHYHSGNAWKIHQGDLASFEPGLLGYLRSLAERAYPFDRISVQYSGYHTDNSPPAMKECAVIRAWNEKYAWPRLRSATAREFLQHIAEQHADQLPVHRQAWPDWWTDGFGSAARETAASRQTHASVQTTETLLAMGRLLGARLAPDIMNRVNTVYENLLFYDEHTYGAAESISDPLAENTMVQWGEKAAYVWEAVKQAALLREEALGALHPYLPRSPAPTIAILNTLNWQRSGLVEVFIDDEILPRDRSFRLVDVAEGQPIPAQAIRHRSEGAYWALWAKDVPPLGYKCYRVELGEGHPAAAAEPEANAEVLENAFYRLTIDGRSGGVTSLTDKQTGSQLVDRACGWHCGQLLYETLPGSREFRREAFRRTGLRNVRLRPGPDGPIWKSIHIQADMDGCEEGKGVDAEIRLFQTEKRLEFHYAIRKLPVRSPEAVYVAFPFALPEGTIFYEGQGGTVRPGKDQIPGSAADWQTVQNFVAIRAATEQIILGSDQIPLVQLSDLNLGKWQPVAQIERPHVYSWVMNNYWFTNFRATQEGELKFSYYLTSTSETSNAAAARFGWGARVPMVPRVLPPGTPSGAPPVLASVTIDAPHVVLVSAHPARYGDEVILHVRELDGEATALRVTGRSAAAKPLAVAEVSVLEQPLAAAVAATTLRPYETKFLRVVPAHRPYETKFLRVVPAQPIGSNQ